MRGVSVTCPDCLHTWTRKPSKAEAFAGKSVSVLSKKQVLYLLYPYCFVCGEKFQSIDEATIDHIYPKSKGGKNQLINLALACSGCNLKKGATIMRRGDV